MSIVLTGFTSSIGNALLNEFLNQGKHVYCLGRNDTKDLISQKYQNYKRYFSLDFNSKSFPSDLEKIFSKLKDKKVDSIIHAAADAGRRDLIKNLSYKEVSYLININHLNSAWFLKSSCDLLSLNQSSPNKSFIYISTQLAKYKGPGLSIYSSSKAAINNLCKTLAHEYGPDGVRINIVSPGKVSSDFESKPLDHKDLNIPLSRLAYPSDIVNAVSFLLSEESSYITANNIDLNGGR